MLCKRNYFGHFQYPKLHLGWKNYSICDSNLEFSVLKENYMLIIVSQIYFCSMTMDRYGKEAGEKIEGNPVESTCHGIN